MRALLGTLGASILLAGLSAGAVPEASPAATVDQAHQLARYLNSGDRVEELTLSLMSAMPQIMAGSPEWGRLVDGQPDRTRAIMLSVRPVVARAIADKLPLLWDRIAAVYRRNLTPAESRALLAGYAAPANVKLTRAMMQRIDFAWILNAQGRFDHGRAATMTAQAYPAALATLTPAERAQVTTFRATPLAAKLAGLRGQVAGARAAWLEEVAPAMEAAVIRALPAASASR